ncbi:MAG: anthrone oxygenase family protein [Dongiaceae bacterium]
MVTNIAALCAFATVLLAGAMTGLYFAFTVAVMPGLNALPAETAVATMRSINRRIINPYFFVAFLGMPFAALASGVLLMLTELRTPAFVLFASGGVYLIGSLVPTMIINVPLNLTLERGFAPADANAAATLWVQYAKPWTRWNTIRAIATALSLLLATLALFWWGWSVFLR